MAAYVDTFMETRAPQIDPAFQISATDKFVEKRRKQRASQEAQRRTKVFKTLVGAFVKQTKRDDLAKFQMDRRFCWEDVKEMASDSIDKDADAVKWRKNPFRAAGRSLQQSASNLETLLKFLPEGELTGVLCGALTLVFCAAKRLDDVRKKILTCLESLPEIVGQTQAYVDMYIDDPKVWSAAEDLYIGILDGVEAMLSWIDKSAFERAFRSLLAPATFGQNLEETAIKKNIEDKVTRFHSIVMVNLHRNAAVAGKNYNVIESIQVQLNTLYQHAKWHWSLEAQQTHRQVNKPFIHLDQLRQIINAGPQLQQKEVEMAVIDAQNVCPPELISHALCVMRNSKFATWLQSDMSQILLIEGRMQLTPEQETSSPLTILSCFLSQSTTNQSNNGIALLHLCGQHTSPGDARSGPNWLLRCLNSQLIDALSRGDVDLSAVDMSFVQAIQAQRLDALAAMFRLLLSSAIGRAVFVLIDGVSWMEEGQFAQDFGNVVGFLRNLVNEINRLRPRLRLKVLLTNPSTSLYGHQWLPGDCILGMDDVDGDEIPADVDSYFM